MAGKIEEYREALRKQQDWRPYLLEHSGLPGPRGNIELARAVAEEGDETLFEELAALGPDEAPTGAAEEFLAFCGVSGPRHPRCGRRAGDPLGGRGEGTCR